MIEVCVDLYYALRIILRAFFMKEGKDMKTDKITKNINKSPINPIAPNIIILPPINMKL